MNLCQLERGQGPLPNLPNAPLDFLPVGKSFRTSAIARGSVMRLELRPLDPLIFRE